VEALGQLTSSPRPSSGKGLGVRAVNERALSKESPPSTVSDEFLGMRLSSSAKSNLCSTKFRNQSLS
jgi:hypothetical protein